MIFAKRYKRLLSPPCVIGRIVHQLVVVGAEQDQVLVLVSLVRAEARITPRPSVLLSDDVSDMPEHYDLGSLGVYRCERYSALREGAAPTRPECQLLDLGLGNRHDASPPVSNATSLKARICAEARRSWVGDGCHGCSLGGPCDIGSRNGV